jgi:putative oxidoreductase
MVEGLGFYPGALWSLLLACTEFFGGIFIAIGFLTRPAAFAGLFVLLVTVWFHLITMGQGFSGAEKSLLWAAILLFFVIRGGNRHSIDARMDKAF